MKLRLSVALLFACSIMLGGPIGYFAQVLPILTPYVQGADFETFALSGGGTALASVQPIGGSGCATGDFTGFTAGHIAMIQRGSCSFSSKGLNSEAAGASGFIVFDNLVEPMINPGYVVDAVPDIPGVFITNALGASFAQTPNLVVSIQVVPEPATSLFLAGGVCLLLMKRRWLEKT